MEPIAIIGAGCRFPGADGPGEFWRLLRHGVDAVTEVPAARWSNRVYYDANPAAPGKTNSRWGGFLRQVDGFDADFFRIAGAEAEKMDPQQRLLLEVCWEALEDAALKPEKLEGSRTGVFAGVMYFEYGHLQMARPDSIDAYMGTGTCLAVSANRISYFFDFTGPSLVIDTACSSSAVAVHAACESLRREECDLALAGGVSLMLTPSGHIFFTKAGIMAPDGRTKTFDAAANGVVRGEGAGIVVLKRYSEALRDCDPIYALILGGAVNQDGRSNGLMAPNGPAQEALLRLAYRNAGVSPGAIQYVELHGTGTQLGDPIEARALGAVLAEGRPSGSRCPVGSVKSNIGHLEPAAGIAGILKTALMLRHGELAPSLNYHTPNPHIPFDRLPIRVQSEVASWPGTEGRSLAGVNSFGFGGTNVHLVMQGVPDNRQRPAVECDGLTRLLPLSARTRAGLRELAASYGEFLREPDGPILSDICYTAGAGRMHHEQRLALPGRTRQEMAAALTDFAREGRSPDAIAGEHRGQESPRVAFVFGGQGSQYWNMGRDLLEREPVFRQTMEACDKAFAALSPLSLIEELTASESCSRLGRTDVAQPALFALQIALCALWRSWRVEPAAAAGHSLGEIAAAHVLGALSLEDAARIVYERARLMQQATGRGRMAAVELSAEEAAALTGACAEHVSVAAVNASRSVVLSGDTHLIGILETLQSRGVIHRMLPVDYAFHSPQMQTYGEELRGSLDGVRPRASHAPLFSTVTGGQLDTGMLTADHWADQLTRPVRFREAMNGLLGTRPQAIIEIGPQPTLARSIASCLQDRGQEAAVLASLQRNRGDRRVMLESLAALYVRGLEPEWQAVNVSALRVNGLPHYAWNRRRYWLQSSPVSPDAASRLPNHPLLGWRIENPHEAACPKAIAAWESRLDCESASYLAAHRIQNTAVMPGAAFVEMAIAAAVRHFGREPLEVTEIRLSKALFLDPVRDIPMRLWLQQHGSGLADVTFSIASCQDGAWETHASGRVRVTGGLPEGERIEDAERRCVREMAPERHYDSLRRRGFDYGPPFHAVRSLLQGEREATARVSLGPDLQRGSDAYELHPVLLDTSMQVLMAALPPDVWADTDGGAFMPDAAECVRVRPRVGDCLRVHAVLEYADDNMFRGNARFFGESGAAVLEIVGLQARRLDRHTNASQADPNGWLYEAAWTPDTAARPAALGIAPGTIWVVLSQDPQIAGSLATAFDRHGVSVLAGSPNDLHLLEAGGDGRRLGGVIYVCGDGRIATAPGNRAEELCIEAVLVIQAVARHAHAQGAHLWFVTCGGQPMRDDPPEALGLAAAAVWGLGVAAAPELPGIWGGLIDIPPDCSPEEGAGCILDAIAGHAGERQSAYRNGKRMAPRLRRARNAITAEACSVHADGTYLITGGLGGLGLKVAGWLVEQGARHVALLSRTALPHRQRCGAIQELEQRGASIQLCPVDVADPIGMEALLSGFRAGRCPPLRGVFHCAGVAGEGALAQLDAARLAEVLRPKVKGAWLLHSLLHSLLRDDVLDYFVLFSSAAALLSSHAEGLAAYAAANRFLDALAHYRRSLHLPAVSINWGPWRDVGMARPIAAALESRGIGTLTSAQGVEALSRVLRMNPIQIAVMPMHWERWERLNPGAAADPFVSPWMQTTARHQPDHPAVGLLVRLGAASQQQQAAMIEAFLIERLEKHLRLGGEPLDPNRPLSSCGLDSLGAVEVKNCVERELGVAIPIVEFMKGLSVRQLAYEIAGLLGQDRTPGQRNGFEARESAPDLIRRLDDLPSQELDALLERLLTEQETQA